ncbi:MAG: primosomal protein N' [Bacilli bacterium]|nr:primosomal protein N' [Bacilli bacterium]
MNMYADILVQIKSKQVDSTFTYEVPEALKEEIKIGKRVLVPFGSQKLEGYVLNLKDTCSIKTKRIIEIIDETPVLNEELLSLGKQIQEETLCSLSAIYSSMLPKALKAKAGVKINKKMVSYLFLAENKETILESTSSKAVQNILELFNESAQVLKKEANKVSSSAVKTLLKKGFLKEIESEEYRYHPSNSMTEEKKKLNEEQEWAYKKILESQKNQIFLLHGVTGSGKTEVYLQVIEEVLKRGNTALVLVPEISLTPQFVSRFESRFKGSIAVLHSSLSDGERYDEYRKILREEVSIVIGTRSAIFAPLKNIGIIILDEEHSSTYKQENNPKYHAIEVAKLRSKYHKCPLVLGSATPTLNTLARALKKIYVYLPLTKRAASSSLPEVHLIDMEAEMKSRHPILSRELECKMIEALSKNEQILLLLNRRGHSTTITCSNCGFTYRCPNCNITLTYHKTSKNARCHYCGCTKYVEDTCPNCKEKSLNYYGLGTEKLEDYLENVFPTARILRMDADTTVKKGEYEKMITAFYNHEYDILLGTQMISKGLDFKNVSIVGILNADASLNIPDYKSNETTYALLSQASGRAGRSKIKGEVYIQTFYKENYVLKCVQKHDYLAFAKYEMKIRQTLKYPPYYYLVLISIKSKYYEEAIKEAKKVKEYLSNHVSSQTIILGPALSGTPMVNKIYHFEILTKYKKDDKIKPTLKELDEIYLTNHKVQIDYDFYH